MNIGAQLRASRESKGLSIETVAHATRVQPRILSAIELNDVAAIPPRPFGRGFVRAYAREIGLDAESIVSAYFAQFAASAPVPVGAATRRDADATPWPLGWIWAVAALAIVLGVTAVGIISFLFLLDDSPWYFIVLRFIEGAAGGAVIPAANAYVIDSVPAKERGAAFGWVGSANSAGFMLGPAIGGILGDWLGYTAPFIFGGIVSLFTAVLLWVKMTNPKPGTETTRTRSPYFSPKSAMAPEAMASCVAFTSVRTGVFFRICSLTTCSISTICAGVTGLKCAKSNRSRSGATSDPACLTWGPST